MSNADNRKTEMTDGDGMIYYVWDAANRLTERDTPENRVDFSYYADNSLDVRTLVGVGTSTYTRDAAGRTTSVAVPGVSGSESTSYTYDAANRMLTTTFANGDVETDTYSGTTADLTSVVHTTSASTTIASYAYSHNSDGRITQETLADGSYYSYGYDSAGQLTSESLNSGGSGTLGALHGYSYAYTYDGAGNRATKYNGTSTDTYSYDSANKLTSVGTKSYSYDDAGNCTSVYNSATGDTVSMTYDAESRMLSASDSASTFSDTYSYNGLDQRVGKVDNTGTFAYTRDGDEVDDAVLADGAAVYNHGDNGNSLISENRGGASKYYHSDALRSIGVLTNSSETTTDTHVTDAFGMSISGSGSTPTPFGFVGQGGYQSDSDTGLMLCGHRYYDSSTGRFLSRDPICAGYNWYTYCGNDPVNATDPQGLWDPATSVWWNPFSWFNQPTPPQIVQKFSSITRTTDGRRYISPTAQPIRLARAAALQDNEPEPEPEGGSEWSGVSTGGSTGGSTGSAGGSVGGGDIGSGGPVATGIDGTVDKQDDPTWRAEHPDELTPMDED